MQNANITNDKNESVVYLTVTRNVKCMRKLHVTNELLHIRN